MADAYGRDIPTNLPRVTEPEKGNSTPRHLKRVRRVLLNERDAVKLMDEALNVSAPQLQRILFRTWNAQKEALKYEELVHAVRTGSLDQAVIAKWRESMATAVNEKMAPIWFAEGVKGALATRMPTIGGTPSEAIVARLNGRVDDWTKLHSAEFVTEMSTAQREAIQNVVRLHTTQEPMGAVELGRFLRPLVGLRSSQVAAVEKYRAQLVEKGSTPFEAVTRSGIYASRLEAGRAALIARTEVAFALSFGELNGLRDAVDAGDVGKDEVAKVWSTSGGNKVCGYCAPLDGKVVGLEETYPGTTKRIPNTLCPPGHPACRCVLTYEVRDSGEDVAPEPIQKPLPAAPIVPPTPVVQEPVVPVSVPANDLPAWAYKGTPGDMKPKDVDRVVTAQLAELRSAVPKEEFEALDSELAKTNAVYRAKVQTKIAIAMREAALKILSESASGAPSVVIESNGVTPDIDIARKVFALARFPPTSPQHLDQRDNMNRAHYYQGNRVATDDDGQTFRSKRKGQDEVWANRNAEWVMYHEIGHAIEACNPSILWASLHFRKGRKFVSDYSKKVYAHEGTKLPGKIDDDAIWGAVARKNFHLARSTEVLSTGIERLVPTQTRFDSFMTFPEALVDFEHFAFTVAALRGCFGDSRVQPSRGGK